MSLRYNSTEGIRYSSTVGIRYNSNVGIRYNSTVRIVSVWQRDWILGKEKQKSTP